MSESRDPRPGWRPRTGRLTAALLAVALGSAGCLTPLPEPASPPPAGVGELTQQFIAEVSGTVSIQGESAPGGLRFRYDVAPGGAVVLRELAGWVDDIDLPIEVLGWEVSSEPLRCTKVALIGAVDATLESPNQIRVDAGQAELAVESASSRKPSGDCGGSARGLRAKNSVPFSITHDPEADSVALTGSFSAEHEGQTVIVHLDLEGEYVNRPPVAEIAYAIAEEPTLGCPPSKAIANTPDGLLVSLSSRSSDPDGNVAWNSEGQPDPGNPKFLWPRADIRAETWLRSNGPEIVFLGQEHSLEPQLFAAEQDHWVALEVQDRSGARHRKICSFSVAELQGVGS